MTIGRGLFWNGNLLARLYDSLIQVAIPPEWSNWETPC